MVDLKAIKEKWDSEDALAEQVKKARLKERNISLRDWFAGQALIGIATGFISGKASDSGVAALCAYSYADAMLKVRAKSD